MGRKSIVSEDIRNNILKAITDAVTKVDVAKKFGIGRATVYRVIEKAVA